MECSSRSAVIGGILQLSIRGLFQQHGVHRRTVRQVLTSAVSPPRKTYRRRVRPAIDDWAELIDSWLIADPQALRKQRHTPRRVWRRLVAEHGATMSEVTVTRLCATAAANWAFSARRRGLPRTQDHHRTCQTTIR